MTRLLFYAGLALLAWYFLAPKLRGTSDLGRARNLLGVGPTATRDEIIAAHRRLVTRVHPDTGGTEGLAAELNAARDLLLKHMP